jgi:hypothetical protein
MKPFSYLLLSVILVLAGLAVARPEDQRAPRRFKGVELYSWQDPKTGWMFALLDGTNRLKTENEVKNAKHRITGVAELKKELARLAVGEDVFWIHRITGFEYPPDATSQEIREQAKQLEITLHLPDPMK